MSSAHDPAAPTSAAPEYEFVKLLGRGGMAEVYLAHKFAPGGAFKEVAFKRILPQFTSDPTRVSKFMDEIAVAAALVHPNIVGVHHWGELGGDYFVELELIRGVTLMELIHGHAPAGAQDGEAYGPIAPLHVATIGAQMLQGLHYAHTFERSFAGGAHLTGVVHRDISPDNVMVDLHGFAKINDWGISKALKGADRVASKTSTAAGKPYYHPPEQWRGDPVDARTDLYAVGTTLSLALCGRQLFAASPNDTFEMIVYRVFQGDRPPIAEIAPPDAPPQLVALLEALVQPAPDRRPRTAKELVPAFKQIVRDLAGDLDVARERLAALVKEHYRGDSDTHKALQPPLFSTASAPARSTRRPIDPSTRPDPAQAPSSVTGPTASPRVAQTAALPVGSAPPVYVASGGPVSASTSGLTPAAEAPAAPPKASSPALWAALGGGVMLLVLLAAVAGFVFGVERWPADSAAATETPTDTPTAPPAEGQPAAATAPVAAPPAPDAGRPPDAGGPAAPPAELAGGAVDEDEAGAVDDAEHATTTSARRRQAPRPRPPVTEPTIHPLGEPVTPRRRGSTRSGSFGL